MDIPAELDTEEFREAWEGWKAHRRDLKRVPFTKRAETLALNELKDLGVDRAVYVVNYCVKKNWRGVHPEHVPNPEDAQEAAGEAWEDEWLKLLQAMSEFNPYLSLDALNVIKAKLPPKTLRFIQMERGFGTMCETRTDQMPFMQARFKKMFSGKPGLRVYGESG